jgi:chromosomal replication initiation ATPase DnaA
MTADAGARQLAFDLPHAEGLGPGDFLPAASNRAAMEAVLAWPRWPSPALVLQGPEGAGKTHLARIWAKRAQAVLFRPADIWDEAAPLARLGGARAAVVDRADEVEDEVPFFHLFNTLAERRGGLLLTARLPLAAWPLRLADLRSRLKTAWIVRIDPPADELLAALLVKQFADRQIRIDREVVDYLVPRMERSFAGVLRLVEALDRASLRARRPIRQALAREVLQALTDAAPLVERDVEEHPGGRLEAWISA